MDLEDNKRNLGRTQRDYHDKNLKKIEDKAKKYKAQWERISEEKQSLEVKVKELQDLLNKKTNEVARIDQRYQNLQLKYENSSDEIEKIREELTDANKKNLKLERSLAAPRSTSKHRAKNLSPGYDEFRRTTVPIKTFLASDGFNNINLKLELERTYEEIKRIREERDALKL